MFFPIRKYFFPTRNVCFVNAVWLSPRSVNSCELRLRGQARALSGYHGAEIKGAHSCPPIFVRIGEAP